MSSRASLTADRDPDIEIEKKFLSTELVKVGQTVGVQVRGKLVVQARR